MQHDVLLFGRDRRRHTAFGHIGAVQPFSAIRVSHSARVRIFDFDLRAAGRNLPGTARAGRAVLREPRARFRTEFVDRRHLYRSPDEARRIGERSTKLKTTV